jgi:hypothetical protein
MSQQQLSPWEDEVLLRSLGASNLMMLEQQLHHAPPPWVVEGLFTARSVNVIAGDNTIGKSPLITQLGLAVASGSDFLGRPTTQGPVLYVDAEPGTFGPMALNLVGYLGLPTFPKPFVHWSPFGEMPIDDINKHLTRMIETFKPSLVIVDPLRLVFPKAEDTKEVAGVIAFQRKLAQQQGCAWINIHHLRKEDAKQKQETKPSLIYNPERWLQEVAGARGIINHCDTRLGVETQDGTKSDLVIGGQRRGVGNLPPMFVKRVYANEQPVGYDLIIGTDTLSSKEKEIFEKLPPMFTFSELRHTLNTKSDDTTSKYLKAFQAAQLISKVGNGNHTKWHKLPRASMLKEAA